jgi:hypothetical protein
MRRVLTITLIVSVLSAAVIAQNREEAARRLAAVEAELQARLTQMGSWTRAAVETRVTRGKPYSGEAVTEFIQTLGDGNRIVRRSTARMSRDSEGRTRREEVSENGAPEKNSVVITDPVAGTSLILNAETRTALKSPAMFARVQGAGATATAVFMPQARGHVEGVPPKVDVEVITIPGAEGRRAIVAGSGGRGGPATFAVTGRGGAMTALNEVAGESTKEDLGQQSIEGVAANGTRTTTMIAAGTIGNEQPITIVSEQWFSPDLEMLVLTRHSDPRVGETTYRLTNITRNEPDRSLFQAPPDYTIQEGRKVAPIPPPPPPPPMPPPIP